MSATLLDFTSRMDLAHVARGEAEQLVGGAGDAADPQVRVDRQHRDVHAAEEPAQLVVGEAERDVAAAELLVDGRELLVRRLELVVGALERVVHPVQLVVAREELVVRAQELFVRRPRSSSMSDWRYSLVVTSSLRSWTISRSFWASLGAGSLPGRSSLAAPDSEKVTRKQRPAGAAP